MARQQAELETKALPSTRQNENARQVPREGMNAEEMPWWKAIKPS